MKTPKLVKPLIKDFKNAAVVLAEKLNIKLKFTKSGSLSIESVGYLKGYLRVGIHSTIQDVVEELVDVLGLNVSATDLALYYRNEREQIKNEAQRIDVVSRVYDALYSNLESDTSIPYDEDEDEGVDEDEDEDYDEGVEAAKRWMAETVNVSENDLAVLLGK